MNSKVTLIVVVIAVALGLFVLITMNPSTPTNTVDPNDPANIDRTDQRLFDPATFDPNTVRAIEISGVGDEAAAPVRFEKQDRVWLQTQPTHFRMDAFAIRKLATAAADLTISQTYVATDLEDENALQELGLDPPAATITYTSNSNSDDQSEQTAVIHLGKIFVGGQAYAQLADDPRVYVVTDDLHKRVLQHDYSNWRDMTIFESLSPEMSRIEIVNDDDSQSVALRQINRRWYLTQPIQTHASAEAVGALTQSLIGAQVRGWVNDQPDNYTTWGLDQSPLQITVETDRVAEDGSVSTDTQSLHLGYPIGMTDTGRYCRKADLPHVFTVDGQLATLLFPSMDSLISRTVIPSLPADIRSLTINGPAGTFSLQRTTEGTWEAIPDWEEEAFAVNPTAVDALLARLTTNQDGAFLGSIPEDDVVMTIAADSFDGNTIATIAIGTGDVNGIFRVVFDDGSGALRFTDDATLPTFVANEYRSGVGVNESDPNAPATDPDDASK